MGAESERLHHCLSPLRLALRPSCSHSLWRVECHKAKRLNVHTNSAVRSCILTICRPLTLAAVARCVATADANRQPKRCTTKAVTEMDCGSSQARNGLPPPTPRHAALRPGPRGLRSRCGLQPASSCSSPPDVRSPRRNRPQKQAQQQSGVDVTSRGRLQSTAQPVAGVTLQCIFYWRAEQFELRMTGVWGRHTCAIHVTYLGMSVCDCFTVVP